MRTTVGFAALLLLAPLAARAQGAAAPRIPDVAWPIYRALFTAEGRVVDLEYYADGRLRVRAAGHREDRIDGLSEWQELASENDVNPQLAWPLAQLRTDRKAIARAIADLAKPGEAGTAAAAALRANAQPLFVVHLLLHAAKAERDPAAKQAMVELAARIERDESLAYASAVDELRTLARPWVTGRMEDHTRDMIKRGPATAPARLFFVTAEQERIGVIAGRSGAILLVRASESGIATTPFANAQALRAAFPLVHLAWAGPDQLPSVRSN